MNFNPEKLNWDYLFKHWFATILLSPIIFDISYLFLENTNNIVGLVEVYYITIIFGFLFSIPTYLVYSIAYYILGKRNFNINLSKLILISLAIIGILISFYITFNNRQQEISIAYVFTSIVSGLFFKLNFKNHDHHSSHHQNKCTDSNCF